MVLLLVVTMPISSYAREKQEYIKQSLLLEQRLASNPQYIKMLREYVKTLAYLNDDKNYFEARKRLKLFERVQQAKRVVSKPVKTQVEYGFIKPASFATISPSAGEDHSEAAMDKMDEASKMIEEQRKEKSEKETPEVILYKKPETQTASSIEKMLEEAQHYQEIGNWREAEKIYLKILENHPELSRAKLDLALLYMRVGYNKDSKELFEKVLGRGDTPEVVKNNIEMVLKQVKQGLKEHQVSGVALVGLNADSNGNSVSNSGNVLVADILLPLNPSSQAGDDVQTLALASVNHLYNFDFQRQDDFKTQWFSNVTAYSSEQRDFDSLDIRLLSFKTGPKIKHIESGMGLSINAGYNMIKLAGEEYQQSLIGEVSASYPVSKEMIAEAALTYEHRHYVDTLTNNTISLRTGEAYQAKTGFKYALTPKDIFNASVFFRQEVTRREYYDNNQIGFSGGLLHSFDNGVVANFASSYKYSDYDGIDPFVSSTIIRSDQEFVNGVNVSKEIVDNITASVGYQFKELDSSLQNYKYKNHRLSTSLAYSF